jgi:hypothetical protein
MDRGPISSFGRPQPSREFIDPGISGVLFRYFFQDINNSHEFFGLCISSDGQAERRVGYAAFATHNRYPEQLCLTLPFFGASQAVFLEQATLLRLSLHQLAKCFYAIQ